MVCRALALSGLKGIGGPRCGAPATHRTPDGMLLCERHATVMAKAAHGPTLLGVLLRARKIEPEPVEVLLRKWRIQ